MVKETQESLATLPSQVIAKVREDLLNGGESELYQHTHSQPDALPTEERQSAEHSVNDDAPKSLPATAPEIVEFAIPPHSTPLRAKTAPRLPTIQSAPADMGLMVQSTPSQDALKAASFHGNMYPDGDTQPMPSQVYHEERASVLRQSMAATSVETPMKSHMEMDTELSTAQSTRLGLATTPYTLQQDQSGYVDLAAGYRDSSPVHSTQGDEEFDELLRDPSSPQPQFQVPVKPSVPETPTLAGQKHGRDGELLTSVTTVRTNATSWGYSQAFGQQNADLMGRSQLFAQTQAASSPMPDGPRSDPIQSRPSPNLKERDDVSSPLMQPSSSPVSTRNTSLARVLGDPKSRYKTMAEELKDRMNARAFSEHLELSGDPDEDDAFDDDSYQDRIRLKNLRRTLSDHAMISAARVKAPARPGSRRPSKASSRPSSSRKECDVIDIVTPWHSTRRARNDEDDFLDLDKDDDEVAEEIEEHLPEKPVREDDHGEQVDQIVENETDNEIVRDDDIDEYDELNQGLRSQVIDPDDEDDSRSAADSVEQPDVEMQGERFYSTEQEGMRPDSLENARQNTQQSTVADSQPNTGSVHVQLRPVQQVQESSLTSFVPGSQYVGKTSEDQALLHSSQRRSQSRVPASQLPNTQSGHAEKSVGSPALPNASDTLLGNSTVATSAWQSIIQQSNTGNPPTREESLVQEIPESDLPDAELEECRESAFETTGADEEMQKSDPVPPYSIARTHVSGSARSSINSVLERSPVKTLSSQQIRQLKMSPRKAAGVRRFAEMATGLTPSNGSFETVDVDDIMNAVMTDEDREIVGIGDSTIRPPRSKRRKITHNSSLSSEDPLSIPYIEAGDTFTAQDNMASEAQGTTSAQEPSLADPAVSHQALRECSSKGNELAHSSSEEAKSQNSMSDNTQSREKQGAVAVSQHITARPTSVSKRKRPATHSNRSTGKSSSISKSRIAKQSTRARPAEAAKRNGKEGHVEPTIPERADQGVEDLSIVGAQHVNITKAPAIGRDKVLEAFAEQPNDGEDSCSAGLRDPVVAPRRIFALFKGTYRNFYPATWLAGSADGMTYKVRFDDATVTNIEPSHVSRLDLQIGDLVKVDVAGMKTKSWRIVDFVPPAQNADEHKLGVDIRGHARLKVQAKTRSTSLAKAVLSSTTQDEGPVEEVAISEVYLTTTMWPNFQARVFKQPWKAKCDLDRADTPSTRSGTPSIETPSSRSRRLNMPPTKTKALGFRIAHLRDASVASSNSSNSASIFGGMAFAISYGANENQKEEVTRLIRRHGGTILNDGFEELFELPNIEEPSGSSPKKSPSKKDAKPQPIQGLRLKAEHEDLGFVALIADRHSRRAKYMQALALGLPTLSGRWIIDSLDAGKNISLADGEVAPLPWDKYLLPAGESSYLGGAVRSRTLSHYDAKAAELESTISARPVLLDGGCVLIVAPKKGKASWDKRKTYAFLTLALGAAQVKRVNDLQEAKALIQEDTDVSKWIYVDGEVSQSCATLFDKSASGKKRKREYDAVVKDAGNTSAKHGNVRVVNDEFVIQSLILGALTE